MVSEGVSEAAPLAGDGFSGVSGVQLDVDLGMSSSDFSSSLDQIEFTKHLTTAWSE